MNQITKNFRICRKVKGKAKCVKKKSDEENVDESNDLVFGEGKNVHLSTCFLIMIQLF